MDKVNSRDELPLPAVPELTEQPWNIAVTGVGGTGVLTIGALLGMAAHIDGAASMVLDMAGLAQKGGAVLSHVRLAAHPEQVRSPHIVSGSADLLIGADAVVAASSDGQVLCDPQRTAAVLNTATAPVAGFVRQRDFDFQNNAVESVVADKVRNSDHFLAFSQFAQTMVGDSIATNVMMLGYAWQQGLVPLSFAALDQAIELNGVAVEANRSAFYWGRKLSVDPQLAKTASAAATTTVVSFPPRTQSLDEILSHRVEHLENYQSKALARRYTERVRALAEACQRAGLSEAIPVAAARQYARLLAYKDEYEVARLYSLPEFRQRIEDTFEGDYKLNLHLAPPLLGKAGSDGRPAKRAFGPWVLRLFGLLQHGKRVRGTVLDVFGYSAERQRERQWIRHFESDMQRLQGIVASLDSREQKAMAVQIMTIPDAIRGFGVVKHDAMVSAEDQRQRLWSALESLHLESQSVAA